VAFVLSVFPALPSRRLGGSVYGRTSLNFWSSSVFSHDSWKRMPRKSLMRQAPSGPWSAAPITVKAASQHYRDQVWAHATGSPNNFPSTSWRESNTDSSRQTCLPLRPESICTISLRKARQIPTGSEGLETRPGEGTIGHNRNLSAGYETRRAEEQYRLVRGRIRKHLTPIRVQSGKTGGMPLPLRTAWPDWASSPCHLPANVTCLIA